jgi:hypothetical protein
MEIAPLAGFNGDMTRCLSCDGILTKDEAVCYQCGDPVPERQKSGPGVFSLLLTLGLIASIGFTVYTFLLGGTL